MPLNSWFSRADSPPVRAALKASKRAFEPSVLSQLRVFRSLLATIFVPLVPTYRSSTVVFFATSRWISKFQFCVYGETRSYVVIPSDRCLVVTGKGAEVGVPAGNGIGNDTALRFVYV